MSSGDVIK